MTAVDSYLPDGSLWSREVHDTAGGLVVRFAANGDGTWERTRCVDGVNVVDTVASVDACPADPLTVLTEVGTALAAIPESATSTEMRTVLRGLGDAITAAIAP